MSHFLQGLILGFSIAAPVGPIGLLCIRRSLNEGKVFGFVSGLGAATVDAAYGLVAALGLTAITRMLIDYRAWLQLGGGLFLLYLGLATLRRGPAAVAVRAESSPHGLGLAYGSTFVLTLANPMTILSFVGIFAGLGVGASAAGAGSAGMLVAGVFAGSAMWWLLLSTSADWLGERLRGGGLRVVNFLAGLVIAAFGGWQVGQWCWDHV